MELLQGSLYFIGDDFFEKVEDSNLMVNYATTPRPHYYAVRDVKMGLLWRIPCSSRVEKYQRIIHDRKNRHRSTLGVRIVKIRGEKTVLLFQSMFATVYKGNIIKNLIMDCQSYTKYRPNETTGGIFVSWRRKEELPTGA